MRQDCLRAQMLTGILEGKHVKEIAERLGVRPNTVIDWRKRFESEGVEWRYDHQRPIKQRHYTEEFRRPDSQDNRGTSTSLISIA